MFQFHIQNISVGKAKNAIYGYVENQQSIIRCHKPKNGNISSDLRHDLN